LREGGIDPAGEEAGSYTYVSTCSGQGRTQLFFEGGKFLGEWEAVKVIVCPVCSTMTGFFQQLEADSEQNSFRVTQNRSNSWHFSSVMVQSHAGVKQIMPSQR
jgi:hypothetical protein